MHLSADFYTPSSIYVPRVGSYAVEHIARGSAVIAAFPSGQIEDGRILVYFEGNLIGAGNLKRFAERCDCAHGRMAQRYPTVALGQYPEDDLIHVGTWHPDVKVVEVRNVEALAAWCGWTLPIDTRELSAGY